KALTLARAAMADLEPAEPLSVPAHAVNDPHTAELFLRLLFSALVDADYLDTEAHFRAEQAAARSAAVSVADLWERFQRDQARLEAQVRQAGRQEEPVIQARDAIYQACLQAAERPPGLFRLTAPT